MSDSLMRLNKALALQLGVGRRQADDIVARGKVLVNGVPARMGQQVAPTDKLTVGGHDVALTPRTMQYIAFHKPVGYVCSRRQQGDNPTIYDLLPKEYHHLHPVGRLDKDSSGLLLLSNDGQFALRMTHPRFAKRKEYQVVLNKPLRAGDAHTISQVGVLLPDGNSKLELTRAGDDQHWTVTMHEGRNRQIRRTFTVLGYTVTQLHRTHFGPYKLADLPTGKCQPVTI